MIIEKEKISKKLKYEEKEEFDSDLLYQKSEKESFFGQIVNTHKRSKSESNYNKLSRINYEIQQDHKYEEYLRGVELLKQSKDSRRKFFETSQKIMEISSLTGDMSESLLKTSTNNSTIEIDRMMIKLNREKYQLEKSIRLLDLKTKRLKESNGSSAAEKKVKLLIKNFFQIVFIFKSRYFKN